MTSVCPVFNSAWTLRTASHPPRPRRYAYCPDGNSVSNIFKRAVTETGLEIKVPLHIDVGELVKISTETGEFQGRAKE